MSISTDQSTATRENLEFGYHYRDQIKRYYNRKNKLKAGLAKAYGLIWGMYMSTAMISAMEHHSEFDSRIKNNVLELLTEVRLAMQMSLSSQKYTLTVFCSVESFLNFKQKGKTLREYTNNFKELWDVFNTEFGSTGTR